MEKVSQLQVRDMERRKTSKNALKKWCHYYVSTINKKEIGRQQCLMNETEAWRLILFSILCLHRKIIWSCSTTKQCRQNENISEQSQQQTNWGREWERRGKTEAAAAAAAQCWLLHCSKNLHSKPQTPHTADPSSDEEVNLFHQLLMNNTTALSPYLWVCVNVCFKRSIIVDS